MLNQEEDMGQQVGNKGLKLLGDYIFYKNYSQKKPNGELETWEESVDRIYSMHRNFLISKGYSPSLFDSILKEAKEAEKKKLFLSSQRGRQFASPKFDEGILKHNSKQFNCSFFLVNEPRVFKEAMYLLLSGVGVGFSVVKHIVDQLPPIADKVYESNTIYSIPDSIEGWADAIDHLMNAAFTNGMLPQFDYGQIRAKGELINGKFKAPGPEPLKESIDKIKALLKEAQGRKLKPIEAHRIICFIAQSVVSGGVRRCLPEGSMVHTRYGMIPIEDIQVGTEVLTSDGYRKVLNHFKQGKQKLVRIHTEDSYFDCTPNHKMAVCTNTNTGRYNWVQAKDLSIDSLLIHPEEDIEGRKSIDLKAIADTSYLTTLNETIGYLLGCYKYNEEKWETISSMLKEEIIQDLEKLSNYKNIHGIPAFIWESDTEVKRSFIKGVKEETGLFTLVVGTEEFIRGLHSLLSSCGVQSNISFTKFSNTPFSLSTIDDRGEYFINSDLNYKNRGDYPYTYVKDIEYLEEEKETYDIEVEGNHEFFCNGFLTHNSATISLFSKDDEEMLACKTGNWYETNRELAMANNSVHIPYSEHTTLENYKKIFKYIKEYGEPGIIRTNDYNIGVNP